MTRASGQSGSLSAAGLILLVAGQLLPQMDFSIVNVALDAIHVSLQASQTQLGLIVSLYGLAFAVSLAMSGRLGDHYGRKRLFLIGIASFALASFVCGLAPTIHWLIAARVLQGVAAALLIPQILATIHVTLSGERHSRAIGIYGSVGGLSFIVGQVLGGWLVSADLFGLGWRSIFFINLPVCAVVLYLGQKWIPETHENGRLAIDWPGTLLLAVTVSIILIAISEGPDAQWNAMVISALVMTLPLLLLLWRVEGIKEARGAQPLIPPSLLRRQQVILGGLGLALHTASFGGYMFVVALTLQSGFHFSSLESGNAFIALGLSYFVGSLYVGKFSKRFMKLGYSGVIMCGALINLVGYGYLYHLMVSYGQGLTAWGIFLPMLMIGVGNAFAVNSSLRIGLADVPAELAGVGSALMTTIQQTSVALGTAICAAFYAQNLKIGDDLHLLALKAGLQVIASFVVVLCLIHLFFVWRRGMQRKRVATELGSTGRNC
jgi:EmrB/QacA subfamily drug resistance transporter